MMTPGTLDRFILSHPNWNLTIPNQLPDTYTNPHSQQHTYMTSQWSSHWTHPQTVNVSIMTPVPS